MAEPIGLASGLLALSIFAFNASVSLFETVRGFQFHPKRVRELADELDSLQGALHLLTDAVKSATDFHLSALDLPLLRCGTACKEFNEEILRCSARSGGDRRSFRDWARLRYMNDDIDGFKHTLAGYKSTITVALTGVNLRASTLNVELVKEYQELINTTTDDLEAHLQSIDDKLGDILGQTTANSDLERADLQRVKDERASTQRCLRLCSQLSESITQAQAELDSPRGEESHEKNTAVSEMLTNQGLNECKTTLSLTTGKLEGHMNDLVKRLLTRSKVPGLSNEEREDLTRLQAEWETTRQCIDICSKTESHLKENVSMIDNFASGDESVQFLVSTEGKTIHGKNRGYGDKLRQVGGHLNDASLQQISRDFAHNRLEKPDENQNFSSAYGNTDTSSRDSHLESARLKFQDRHGKGVRLASRDAAETSLPDTPSGAKKTSS